MPAAVTKPVRAPTAAICRNRRLEKFFSEPQVSTSPSTDRNDVPWFFGLLVGAASREAKRVVICCGFLSLFRLIPKHLSTSYLKIDLIAAWLLISRSHFPTGTHTLSAAATSVFAAWVEILIR